MEIWNHFGFDRDSHPLIIRYILDTGINYDLSETICAVDISENDPRWVELAKILKEEDIFCITETKFSKEELCSAEWLTVRSRWYYDYPQPEDKYYKITYEENFLCSNDDCGMKKIQKDCFRLKRTPKWGKRNFCMTNWVYDELFVSPKAKELLETSKLQGFSFLNVLNKSGREELADIYQIQIPYILPEGLEDSSEQIKEVYNCSVCGNQKIRSNGRGRFVFRKNTFINAPDFVKSSEWFGAGGSACRLILVSQKAYKFIVENKLDSSLVFEPIKLV